MNDLVKRGKAKELREPNYEFHMTLYKASQSQQLYEMIANLWARFPWGNLMAIPGRAQQSVGEHEKVLNAIREKNATLGAQMMREHVENAGEALAKYIHSKSGIEKKPGVQ